MPRSKTIQSGRPVRSWEQPFRVADLFQTYLPMLVLIVIMALFIYNLGYFYGLDWRYMSLLGQGTITAERCRGLFWG